MLYLNRRGYAPLVICGQCGEKIVCPHCNVALTEHRGLHCLICHHCGHRQVLPKVCPNCGGGDDLRSCGVGVEKVAEEVQELFPEARVALMTSDSIDSMTAAEDLMRRILHREIDIIIGTQMIAKGHHFPALALVGVLDVDAGFYGGDFRTLEKTYQILSQVSGRAGRAETAGKVLIQAYHPQNPALQALATNQVEEFLQLEKQNRRLFQMPPYGKMIAFILSSENQESVKGAALQLFTYLQKLVKTLNIDTKELEIFTPIPAPLSKIQNRYRYRLLFHAKRSVAIQRLSYLKTQMQQIVTKLQIHYQQKVRIKVDVDPYSFL